MSQGGACGKCKRLATVHRPRCEFHDEQLECERLTKAIATMRGLLDEVTGERNTLRAEVERYRDKYGEPEA